MPSVGLDGGVETGLEHLAAGRKLGARRSERDMGRDIGEVAQGDIDRRDQIDVGEGLAGIGKREAELQDLTHEQLTA